MRCDQNPTTLAAYLDGELPAVQAAALETHLSGCPVCAAEIAAMMSLRRSLIAARARFAPSDEFRRKMQRQIATPKPRRTWIWMAPGAIAIAAMLLLAVGWSVYARRAEAFGEIADLHVNALASANPYDVVSSDRHTVKPWFEGRIPFSFNVPEFAGSEFTLLGGRLVYLHQQPGAQLIVGMRQHKISVLIFQASVGSERTFGAAGSVVHRNNFNVASWELQGLRFYVVGDVDAPEIDQLSKALKKANE